MDWVLFAFFGILCALTGFFELSPPGVLERGGGGQGFFLALGANSQGQKGEGCGKDRSCSWAKRSDSRNRVGGQRRATRDIEFAIL